MIFPIFTGSSLLNLTTFAGDIDDHGYQTCLCSGVEADCIGEMPHAHRGRLESS